MNTSSKCNLHGIFYKGNEKSETEEGGDRTWDIPLA